MNYTDNYKLKKPLQETNYDVDDFNENADAIDKALSQKSEKTHTHTAADVGAATEAYVDKIALEAAGAAYAFVELTSPASAGVRDKNIIFPTGYTPKTHDFVAVKLTEGHNNTTAFTFTKFSPEPTVIFNLKRNGLGFGKRLPKDSLIYGFLVETAANEFDFVVVSYDVDPVNIGITPANIGALALTGGTLTGNLSLRDSAPTADNHATRKRYVDDKVAAHVPSSVPYADSAGSAGTAARVNQSYDGVTGRTIAHGAGLGMFEVGATIDGAAGLSFHTSNAGVNFGLDIDNVVKVGGWSMGDVAHPIYHFGYLHVSADGPTAFVGEKQMWLTY